MNLDNIIILIIGIGGTGANLAKELCRFVSSIYGRNIDIYFMDGDKVEDKNCSRQPFASNHIDENKAVILSELCNSTFNMNVKAIPEYLTSKEQLFEVFKDFNGFPIIIGTVDNHPARAIMDEVFNDVPTLCYIDSANEMWDGEVITGIKVDNMLLSAPRSFYFPNILTDKRHSKEEESCGVINISSPQHLVTNLCAANIILSDIANLIVNGQLQCGLTTFNVLEKSIQFVPYADYKALNKAVIS